MAQSDQERLLSVIRASDALLSEDGDSEDPVASRRVAEALAQKASALWELGRLAQAVGVWDELITHYDRDPATRASLVIATVLFLKARDLQRIGRHHEALAAVTEVVKRSQGLPQNDAVTLVVVRALAVRAQALAALGSVDQAVACDEEMVARADRGDEPELREWATWALEHQSRVLIAAGQIDQALTASARVMARLLDEPPEPLVTVIEIINNHSLLLLQLGAPNPAGVARYVLLVLINTSAQTLGSGIARVAHYLPDRIVRFVGRLWALLPTKLEFVGVVMQSRRRAEQARATSDAVIAKIGSSEEPDLRRCASAAEFIIGLSLIVLGHPLAGIRAIDTFTSRDDVDAIQAFQWLNHRPVQDTSVISELGGVANAALRAHMLGGGDPAITKIAYEDSIVDRQASSAHPTIGRLAARFLRPKVDKTPTGDADSPRDPRTN